MSERILNHPLSAGWDRRAFLGRVAVGTAAVAAGSWLPAFGQSSKPGEPAAVEDPAWQSVAEEIAEALELEARAALLHHGDANRFALTAPTPFQKAVAAYAEKEKPEARKKAFDTLVREADEPEEKRKVRHVKMAAVDVRSKTPVPKQVEAVLSKGKPTVTKAMFEDVFEGTDLPFAKKATAGGKPPVAMAVKPLKKIRLELIEVHVKATTELEWKDEVYFAGIANTLDGKAKELAPFKVGKLKKGQSKKYDPPHPIWTYDLTVNKYFPKHIGFTMLVAEHDFGHGHEELMEALDAIKGYLTKAIEKGAVIAGTAVGTYIGSPAFGAAIGKVLGKLLAFLVEKVFGWLVKLLKDDAMSPVYIPGLIKSDDIWNGADHGPLHIRQVENHGGVYELSFRWHRAG